MTTTPTDGLRLDLDALAYSRAEKEALLALAYRKIDDTEGGAGFTSSHAGALLDLLERLTTPARRAAPSEQTEPVGFVTAAGLQSLKNGFSASIVAPAVADEQFNRALNAAPIDQPGADRAGLVAGHIGWLRTYAQSMTEHNWRDLRLQIERQLDGLVDALSPKESR